MAVRAARIEIFGFAKERRDAWRELAIACQRMSNRLWQIWLCHHSNNDSANKLRKHFDAYREWQQTKQGGKPVWPCKAFEDPLTKSSDPKSFYRILSAEFPGVNVRTRGLLTNAWQGKVNTRKAASGSLHPLDGTSKSTNDNFVRDSHRKSFTLMMGRTLAEFL